MEVTTSAFVAPAHSTLTVEVHVNGEKIIEWKFADWRQQKRVVTIPSDLLKKDKKLVLIEFNILDPISPKALGMSQDSRELGLGVSKLTFSQLSESAAERTRETQ